MSSITKRLLSDQILIRLAGGFPDVNDKIQKEDVWLAIEQKVNSLFKLQHFNMTLPSGETIPENLSIAIYEDVVITSNHDNLTSYLTLPVTPISLPRNVGIFQIIPQTMQPLIPIQAGQRFLLSTDSLLNDLVGDVGYEVYGRKIKITKDLPVLGIDKAEVHLIVMDISVYDENDILPIPADYEQQIIDDLVLQFSKVMANPSIVSNYPEPLQQPTISK